MPVWRAEKKLFQWMPFRNVHKGESACVPFSKLPDAPACLTGLHISINLQRRAARGQTAKTGRAMSKAKIDATNLTRRKRRAYLKKHDPEKYQAMLAAKQNPKKKAHDAKAQRGKRAAEDKAMEERLAAAGEGQAQANAVGDLRQHRRGVRQSREELDEEVATILSDDTLHRVFLSDGKPARCEDSGEEMRLTFNALLTLARRKFGVNIFYTKFCPLTQWGRYSDEARKVGSREGVAGVARKEGVGFAAKECRIIPLYSTAVSACDDAGGGHVQAPGGSVEKRLQDAARASVPDTVTFGNEHKPGQANLCFSRKTNAGEAARGTAVRPIATGNARRTTAASVRPLRLSTFPDGGRPKAFHSVDFVVVPPP